MRNNLSRRDWFKSTFALSALALSPSAFTDLEAAPMSEAEREFFKMKNGNGMKVRLNANENPYGPPEKAKKAVLRILTEGNRYPYQSATDFKKVLADKEGVDPAYICITSGSGRLLTQTGVAYGLDGGRVLSAYPTFPVLMAYAERVKATWDRVDLNEKLEHDYDAIASAIKSDTRLVFISNPNNPTGTVVDPGKVKSFCEEVSGKVPVYSDEAYLEFMEPAQQRSMVELVRSGANVMVSRTFSKVYGLAGLRIGYMVAHPDIIKKISTYGDELSISQTAIAAAKASLGDEGFMKMVREKNAAARKVMTDYLDKSKTPYGQSHINLVFFPAPKDGKTILAKTEEKGFLIRIWDYQQREWCRVSIGTADEMKAFVKVFDEVVS